MFGFMRHHGVAQREWRLHYCGTCKTIGSLYGQRARLLLNHDTAFLAELLNSLNGEDAEQWANPYRSWNCMRLPSREQMPVILRYVSAVNVLLGEYKVRDHEVDSPAVHWRWARRFFSPAFRKAQHELAELGFPLAQTDELLRRQPLVEATQGADLDAVAAPTAEITALVFANGARLAGVDPMLLADVGYRFGRLIYLIDAWEDYDRDSRSGAFNALRSSGRGLDDGAQLIRSEAGAIRLPDRFRRRMEASLDGVLGGHACVRVPGQSLRSRWRDAVARTRKWQTPAVSFALVVAMAFLFHRHARLARSARECLSLGLNLMAVGGVLAMAAGAGDGRKSKVKSCIGGCCSGWEPDCDCCCDGCCDACCAADCCCSGCDCCSACDC